MSWFKVYPLNVIKRTAKEKEAETKGEAMKLPPSLGTLVNAKTPHPDG
jgi:hypothetical protein